MRLFIAVPLPDAVTDQFSDLQQPIDGLRWQDRNQMHLTLKFLGETNPKRVPEIDQKLSKIQLPPFFMTIKGFGYFPKGKQPRVLWTGINKNESLQKLQQSIERTCTTMGFDAETRLFKPHITIARIDGTPRREVMSFINQHKKFRISDVPVDEFVLYESKLSSEGAIYIRKKSFKLTINDK